MFHPQTIAQTLQKARGGITHLNRFLKDRKSRVSDVAFIGEAWNRPRWATTQALQSSDGLLWTRGGDQFLGITSKQESVPWSLWKLSCGDLVLEDLARKLPPAKTITLLEDLEFWVGVQNEKVVFKVSGKFAWVGSLFDGGKIGGKHLVLPGDTRQLVQGTEPEKVPVKPPGKIYLPGS